MNSHQSQWSEQVEASKHSDETMGMLLHNLPLQHLQGLGWKCAQVALSVGEGEERREKIRKIKMKINFYFYALY